MAMYKTIRADWVESATEPGMWKNVKTGITVRKEYVDDLFADIANRAVPRFDPFITNVPAEQSMEAEREYKKGAALAMREEINYNMRVAADIQAKKAQAAGFDDCINVRIPGIDNPQTTEEVLLDRGKEYGSFSDNAELTQSLYRSTWEHASKVGTKLSKAQHEALHMIFLKIGRIANGNPNNRDSWVDIAGYAQLVVDIIDGKNT